MENVKKLLDEAKTKTGAATDYRLAKNLDLPRPRICEYYKGDRFPDEYACMQIAQATGRSFEEVTALVRVEAEKNETRREAWKKRLIQLGGIAASVALPVCAIVILQMTPSTAEAAPHQHNAIGMICIMLNIAYIIQRQTKLRRIGLPSTFGVFIAQVR